MIQGIKIVFMIILRFILKIFYIFPVRKNKIIFSSFGGYRYACNPKYLYKHMKKHHGKNFEFYWVYDSKTANVENFPKEKLVKNNSVKYIYHVLTSKTVVNNVGLNTYLPIRKKQFIVNTWHGGGAYKKVGLALKSSKAQKYQMKKLGKDISVFVSSCEKFSKEMSKSMYVDYNKFTKFGTPRNDMLIASQNTQKAQKIKQNLGIDKNQAVVLYAPTYRDENQPFTKLDITELVNTLNKRFDKNFICLYRGHTTSKRFVSVEKKDSTVDVSDYEDMQKLLYIADVLITDYSSCIWDFSFTKRPCFLYTPDEDKYIKSRNFYTPIEQWPYPRANSNDNLKEIISNFDEEKYISDVKQHQINLGSYETGKASQKLSTLLLESL